MVAAEVRTDKPRTQVAEQTAGTGRNSSSVASQLGAELISQLATVVATVVMWCTYYGRWPFTASFAVPISYTDRGDTLYILGVTRAFSEFPAPWNLHVERLNAPFGADWNDYPHTEKLLFYTWGVLNRFFEIGTTANLAVLLAHVTAAWAFVWAARQFGARPWAAAAGALLYAFSPFMLGRALPHLQIAVVWHIPLLLCLVYKLATIETLPAMPKRVGAAALVVATALQNPYYTALALQLVLLATFRAWLVGRRHVARLGIALAVLCAGTFFLGQLNVFLHARVAGANPTFSGRSLGAVMTWGLRLPDLFLPRNHFIQAWTDFSESHYFGAGNPGTENGFAFLGLVGCCSTLALSLFALLRALQGRLGLIAWEGWVLGYVVLFAIAGGGNYLLAASGMTWLRAANRYSIVILCVGLLWAARAAQAIPWRSVRLALPGLALGVGAWELFARRPLDHAQRAEAMAATCSSDARLGHELERLLPAGAALFQLPVARFPEAPAINDMYDYEQFRPYLWTERLRFSFGTHKGREREEWQNYAASLAPGQMVKYLGEHGFDGILINRKGYADRAVAFEQALGAAATKLATSDTGDLVAYRVQRTGTTLPEEFSPIALQTGFPWGWEEDASGRWAWTNGSAQLRLIKTLQRGRRYTFEASLESLSPRVIQVTSGSQRLADVKLNPGQIVPLEFGWSPAPEGITIDFTTDAPDERPQNGDARLLGFRIINPRILEVRKAK